MFFLKELPTQAMVEQYTQKETELNATTILDALTIMRRASLLVREIESYFTKFELSQLKFLIMIVIDREPSTSSLSPNEIAARLDVSKPVLTRALKTLVESELLSSTEDDIDKRVKRISLTKAGHELLQQLLPGYFLLITEMMERVDAE